MKNVSLDLSHNDPGRLFVEFLDPISKFLIQQRLPTKLATSFITESQD